MFSKGIARGRRAERFQNDHGRVTGGGSKPENRQIIYYVVSGRSFTELGLVHGDFRSQQFIVICVGDFDTVWVPNVSNAVAGVACTVSCLRAQQALPADGRLLLGEKLLGAFLLGAFWNPFNVDLLHVHSSFNWDHTVPGEIYEVFKER